MVACTARMLLQGVKTLDCTLPRGHKEPHRDSGWPLLWTDLLEKQRWSPEPSERESS